MKISGDRRGMTFVELLVVTVIGTLILGTLLEVLITNQRAYATQNEMMQDQQALRGGMELLFGELREISPSDGDLVSMASNSVTIRSARTLGLVCSVVTAGADPVVQARVVGRYLQGDSARVFFENDPAFVGDDLWRTALVSVVDTTGLLTCPTGEKAQSIRLEGVRLGTVADADSITPGGLVRNFAHNSYGLGTYDGEPYLVLTDDSGVEAPLVGPLRGTDGLEFRYLDASGTVTTTAADVRQIEVTLRTSAGYHDAAGVAIQDSLSFRIRTRNSR